MVRRGRPTIDLAYLLGSSTSPEFRKEHLDEILSFYHKTLIDLLTSFGYSAQVYPYDQLEKDFEECFVFGFVMAIMHAMVTT